jgi:hypothetical protein
MRAKMDGQRARCKSGHVSRDAWKRTVTGQLAPDGRQRHHPRWRAGRVQQQSNR